MNANATDANNANATSANGTNNANDATGANVTRDVPENVFAAGNPGRVIRRLTERDAAMPALALASSARQAATPT